MASAYEAVIFLEPEEADKDFVRPRLIGGQSHARSLGVPTVRARGPGYHRKLDHPGDGVGFEQKHKFYCPT